MTRTIILCLVLLLLSGTLLAQTQKVAVIDFETQERSVRTIVNQMMHNRRGDIVNLFDEYEQFELIALSDASRAFSNKGLSSVRDLSSRVAAEIGEELNADVIIWGTVADHSATDIRVTAFIMSVRSRSINQLTFNLKKRSADRREGLKVELFDKISELAGGEITRLFNIGEQQVSSQNYTSARDTFQRIVNIDDSNIDAYFYLGYINFMLNDYESSEEFYRRGLELNPEDERLWNNLAETQRRADKIEDAIESLKQLAEIRTDEMIWLRIGNLYAEINYNYEAFEAFGKALEIDPDFERAHYRLGVLQFDNGYISESIPHLEYISERHPEDELINRKLTAAYLRTNRLDQAIQNYINQIERDPNNTSAYLNLAGAYRTQEKNREALETLNRLVRLEDNNPTVYIRISDVQLALGNINEAERNAQRAIALDSEASEPYLLISQINQVRGYDRYESFIELEEKARAAYGAEANRLIEERNRARSEAHDFFNRANQNLDIAATKTNEPSIVRDINSRKQLLAQLIEETRATFFD